MPVDTPRADYSLALERWSRCRDVLDGSDAVKRAGTTYLPRLGGQTDAEYDAYKMRALFYNGTARTLAALAGTVFRKPPTLQAPAKIDAHLADVTLDDTSLEMFALNQFEDVIGVGRTGILVDMQGDTIPDAQRRPYWVSYSAEQIINWQESRVAGDMRLSQVILKERVEEPAPNFGVTAMDQWRVLSLRDGPAGAEYLVEIYRWSETAKAAVLVDTIYPRRRGQAIPFIPFVVINATSLRARIEKPPLLDLIDVNLSHYRSSADHEHGLHWTALPTPWVVGASADGVLQIGSGIAWELSGPDARAGMLEFTGKGMGAIENNLKMKEERMAILGARMIEGGGARAETAEAVRSRHAATHATLKTLAMTTSAGLTKALRWHAWWMGASEDVVDPATTITLNRDFVDEKLSADDVKAALLAVQAGQMAPETFYLQLQKGGWMREDVTFEQEQIEIEAAEPPAPEPELDPVVP